MSTTFRYTLYRKVLTETYGSLEHKNKLNKNIYQARMLVVMQQISKPGQNILLKLCAQEVIICKYKYFIVEYKSMLISIILKRY